MRELVIVFWEYGRPVSVHDVFTPGFGEPGFYRATISYDCYHNRECTRLYEANKKGRLSLPKRGSVKHKKEFDEDRKSWKESYEKVTGEKYEDYHDKLPRFRHASIWDYYKAVGYDYKKQRYL